jgi:DNA-binding GntR family transcriptional regulator
MGTTRTDAIMTVERQYRTMQEIVYNTIRERILAGQYAPGERLITSDLANELGVSRMPVREALQRLGAATGLVTVVPHKGALVNAASEDDIIEVFQMRVVLEGLVARLACPNIDAALIDELTAINEEINEHGREIGGVAFLDLNREFHDRIWVAAKAPRLVATLKTLHDASRAYRYISINIPGRLTAVVREHRAIIAAFRKGDADAAEKALSNHYSKTLEWLTRSLERAAAKRHPAEPAGERARPSIR